MRSSKALALIFFLGLSACALQPEWQRLAVIGSLDTSQIETGRFQHVVLRNELAGRQLRIYVEGDGTPWIRRNRVSVDPTPANPVLLRLMLNSDHPAAYLGRPCYFGTATSRECDARWWTFERYSQAVIDSMCIAANEIAADASTVDLIGYSGGGAVVLRMGGCTDKLRSITTIAGNLDPAAWTSHHDFTPLIDAVPADMPLPANVAEVHWQCSADENIPPPVTDGYFEKRPDASRHIVDDCTHSTGWMSHAAMIFAETFRE